MNQIKSIFPTPIMIFDVEEHENHKNIIMKYVNDYKESYPLRRDTKGNVLGIDSLTNLSNQIKNYCVDYFRMVCGIYIDVDDIIITNSWLNCIKSTVKLDRHMHRNSHISGVYYINYDPKIDPALTFHRDSMYNTGNPIEAFLSATPERDTPYNTYIHELKINEGQLCMFNSYLCHSHGPKETLGDRVSLAFNCVLKHYFTGNSARGKQYEVFLKKIN